MTIEQHPHLLSSLSNNKEPQLIHQHKIQNREAKSPPLFFFHCQLQLIASSFSFCLLSFFLHLPLNLSLITTTTASTVD